MGVPIELREGQIEYLKQAITNRVPYREMAKSVGVCTDTLKRILVRHGLADFDGAKYIAPTPPKTWQRPCLKCGRADPRPKNQYICDTCTALNDSISVGGGWDTW